MTPRALLLTAFALACFAGNSLLCRLALAGKRIDAASFTAVRLVSGAAVLWLLALRRARPAVSPGWLSAAALFGYAAPFSYAYLRLGAALGALVLFGAVQITMLGWGVLHGERPSRSSWLGIFVAVAGLVGLTLPGHAAPDPAGTLTMLMAGVAWGVYSLRGRKIEGDPLVATAANFARALPFAALLMVTAAPLSGVLVSPRGVALAAASGAVTSGVGYAIWYAALAHLSAARAAVVQLLVPVLAALGAIALLGEHASLRLVLAGTAILSGVALSILRR